MHDDDLSDDDIRDALERRARRAEPAGADALLARGDSTAAHDRRGRGAWMAAAAVLVLLGGLVGYVASVGESEPEQIAGSGDGPPLGELAGGTPTLTASVADLLDRNASATTGRRVLVVNGTWGLVAADVSLSLRTQGAGFAELRLTHVLEPPEALSGVWFEPGSADIANALADVMGAPARPASDLVKPPEWSDRNLGVAPAGGYDVIVVVGQDLDPAGAFCFETRDVAVCDHHIGLDSVVPVPAEPRVVPQTDGVSMLVVNTTWGRATRERFVPSLIDTSGRLLIDEPLRGVMHVRGSGRGPSGDSVVAYSDPSHRGLALGVAARLGIGEELVGPGAIEPGDWSSEEPFPHLEPFDLLLVIGADLDPEGAFCRDDYDRLVCDADRPDVPVSILHPPQEVRVLALNGTVVAGAAGRFADLLNASHGYNTLPPGNAIGPSVTSFAYYVPGYELDARQVAQSLDMLPETVKPLQADIVPAETEGEPHVVVVVGDDLVGG